MKIKHRLETGFWFICKGWLAGYDQREEEFFLQAPAEPEDEYYHIESYPSVTGLLSAMREIGPLKTWKRAG